MNQMGWSNGWFWERDLDTGRTKWWRSRLEAVTGSCYPSRCNCGKCQDVIRWAAETGQRWQVGKSFPVETLRAYWAATGERWA